MFKLEIKTGGAAFRSDCITDKHGDMWECEQCGDHFCSKCFIDRHGRKDFMDMLQNGDEVLCPECYRKEKS